MLSYDWLKILCAIAAAVTALVLFFTMVRVRPARAQNFIVHFYGDYDYGTDFTMLSDVLEQRLSYDVLSVRADRFGTGMMDGASYTARRSSGEGSVAIASAYAEEGQTSSYAQLMGIALGSTAGTAQETLGMFYEADKFFAGLEDYLARFFGEEWKSGEIDRAEAEKCFRARNVDGPNNKNRYRTEAQVAAGVEDEVKRLTNLRSDYLYLIDPAHGGLGAEGGLLSYATYTSEVTISETEKEERVYRAGVNIGKLTHLSSLAQYSGAEGKAAHDEFVFLIYNNGAGNYEDGTNDGRDDLKYEAVTFLKYLVEQYA